MREPAVEYVASAPNFDIDERTSYWEAGMEGTRRVGILGGTFDPIHIGHLSVARHATKALALDEVILMPNGVPAWKLDRAISTASDRWAMAWLATRHEPIMSVSRLEVDRAGITLTVDTIRHLHETLGRNAELWLIAGADTVVDMPLWEGIGEIARSIRIAAVTRPGQDTVAMMDAIRRCPEPLDVACIDMPPMEISSTMLRRLVSEGKDVSPLVGDEVAEYINDAGLYVSDGVPCGQLDNLRPAPVIGRDCIGAGVGGAVIRNGKVLLLRRIRIPGAGKWDLPGGKVELGETMEDAVMREVMEETGLVLAVDSFIASSDYIVPSDEMHFVVSGFLMRDDPRQEPRNMEPGKHSDMAWLPLDDLPSDLTDAAKAMLSAL